MKVTIISLMIEEYLDSHSTTCIARVGNDGNIVLNQCAVIDNEGSPVVALAGSSGDNTHPHVQQPCCGCSTCSSSRCCSWCCTSSCCWPGDCAVCVLQLCEIGLVSQVAVKLLQLHLAHSTKMVFGWVDESGLCGIHVISFIHNHSTASATTPTVPFVFNCSSNNNPLRIQLQHQH